MKTTVPKLEVLEKIMRHIQGVLRLMDWDIEIDTDTTGGFSRSYGKEAELTRGDCARDIKNHEAQICINSDFENTGKLGNGGKYWWYKTLWHEMLHIFTARYDMYAINAVSHLESQSLIDNVHLNMSMECERVVEGLAKIFITVYPLGTVLKELDMKWEELE
jgi:hypothetical protein